MDINCFARLCFLLESVGGLGPTRNVLVSEQVAIFMSILAHHKKNVTVKFDFRRFRETISKHFNAVLDAVLRLHPILAVNPSPVDEDCHDERWKWFQVPLMALTLRSRSPHERSRVITIEGGEVSVNVLGVCDRNMNYIYVLSGWEGSAADIRVLQDAITRGTNRLQIPPGSYYLGDCGYSNRPGFLTPYMGVRYHLEEWNRGPRGPQNHKELFNLHHCKVRNAIERSFGIMKKRWAILRSPTFYSIKNQNKMILACFLLLIRTTMAVDPLEAEVTDEASVSDHVNDILADHIDQVEPTQEWTEWRDTLAMDMYNEWLGSA